VHAYRAAFKHLAGKKRSGKLSDVEKNILAQLKQCKHKHTSRSSPAALRTPDRPAGQRHQGPARRRDFFPKMEQIFLHLGLPPEVTRLALVESSFNLMAVSQGRRHRSLAVHA